MPRVLAHEKWFTHTDHPAQWSFFFNPKTLAFVGAVVVIAVAWRLVDKRLGRPEIPAMRVFASLAPYVPRLLAIHAGVSLLSQASRGTYLAPSLQLVSGWFGITLAIIEGVVGVWLITGFRVRTAAWLLVAAGPLGMIAYGPVAILERADLLGIALFLAILPPGDTPAGAVDATIGRVERAVWALRVLVGASLITLAFTEKLVNPGLALEFLRHYPGFDVFNAIGLGSHTIAFIRLAGAVEILLGLLIISGAAPQVAVIVAGIPFNATLFFLGSRELIGHLPIYGAMLALLVYGSNEQTAPVMRTLWPWKKPATDPRRGAAL